MKKKSFRIDDEKLLKSVEELERALTFEAKAEKDPFYAAGISKSFEICMEYAWKYLKRRVEEEGLEVVSPKDAIKHAGRIGLIADVELWLKCLADRNLAVHDYLGIEDEDYLRDIKKFFASVKRLK